jgi:hypothetical protein
MNASLQIRQILSAPSILVWPVSKTIALVMHQEADILNSLQVVRAPYPYLSSLLLAYMVLFFSWNL